MSYFLDSVVTWAESYELLGHRDNSYVLMGDDRLLRRYDDCFYSASCKICKQFTSEWMRCRNSAILEHFIHCCIRHGYIFSEDYDMVLTPHNVFLQDVITKSDLYELPLPGFDVHDNCIKQFIDGKSVCVLHNLQGSWKIGSRAKYWLGYI